MNANQILDRIRYWTRRSCPKHARLWREILTKRYPDVAVLHVFTPQRRRPC